MPPDVRAPSIQQRRYRYEAPYGPPRPRTNWFAWIVAMLLLAAFALAAWLGSFYVFWQPERPDSYRLLKRLHRIDPPRRFELTAAPAGEFLNPKQLHDRYASLHGAGLAEKNAELTRNYIRNFQQVHGLVPYVVGRFRIIAVHELGPADIFTSGMVALTSAIDEGDLLMEHVYPADARDLPLMRQTLMPGLEIKLERTHDISAVIHAEHTIDGRVLITAMPLLYGTYTVTRGTGTFTLEPPLDLNLAAGWPLFKPEQLRSAEKRYSEWRQQERGSAVPLPGLTPSATPAAPENQLVRVEQAIAVETPKPALPSTSPAKAEKGKAVARNAKNARGRKGSPAPSATPAPVAQSTPPAPAAPEQSAAAAGTLASTAGGGTWKTYPPGRMPLGRLIAPSDLAEIADRGLTGERIYLKGQFVVNFSDANKAVLRPYSRMPASVLRLAGGNAARVIVEYPAGYVPPAPGSTVTRDEARPLEITEVRKQEDGQLNVFAREIMQP
ncbi:MAG: hypothetical protein JO354_12620 [Verrucomicrobia bacterium]|nr:hypothetical protein [Verrucomicrobiota bacterium]